MRQPLVSFRDVSKKLNGQCVIKNLNLNLTQGEIVTLVGPNGSGKTLLLNLILGLVTPDRGTIKIFQQPLEQELSQIRADINFYFPDSPLQLNTTAWENLHTYGQLYCVADIPERIEEYSKRLKIKDLVKNPKKLFTFSSGQRAKVSLCKALFTEPRLLLLDEPTSYLDQVSRRLLFSILRKMNQQLGTTMIISSHEQNHLTNFANKLLVLESGRLNYFGKLNVKEDE